MSRLGLVAASGVLGIALVALFLRVGTPHRGERDESHAAAPAEHARERVELAETADLAANPAGNDEPRGSAREARVDDTPRGPVHGRLVEAKGGAPLEAEKVLLLASPHDGVAESLRTRPDGSFASERRFPRGSLRAWISEPETGSLLGRHEAQFDPGRAEDWLVPVPRPPTAVMMGVGVLKGGVTLHGTVVDLAGRAVEGAEVKVFPLAVPGKVNCDSSTNASGEFRVEHLELGRHRVLVQGRFASSAPLELELVEGTCEAGRIVLPSEPPAGALRGRIVVEGGGDSFVVLVVRDLASQKQLAKMSDWKLFSKENDGISRFEIPNLPAGRYELTLVPVDGRRYDPPFLRVSPPEDGLEFCARPGRARCYRLNVRDAENGMECKDVVIVARIRGQWCPTAGDGLPEAVDRWIAFADGYRPARGDFSGARRTDVEVEDGQEFDLYERSVPLQPGHGQAILFKDVEDDGLRAPEFEGLFSPSVQGVLVFADGSEVARSDADGLALVDLPRAPDRISFRREGWLVVGDRKQDGVRVVHMARER